MSNRWMRNGFIYVLIVLGVITIFLIFFNDPLGDSQEIDITDVIARAQTGSRLQIEVSGDNLTIRDGAATFHSRKEPNSSLVETLVNAGVDTGNVSITVKGSSGLGSFIGILFNFLPLILFGGILLFMMRQAQSSGNQAMGFGKSRARMFVGAKATVTFFDVAGAPEAKEELEEVVEFLKYPERFLALGARIPAGILLIGPPGTGKTLIARAVAGEAGVPFFSISGSEFVEMFVGVGASRVRDLFEQARRHAPCIIFIDEIDAVGRHRGAGLGGGHDEREQTLNQILVEMDGFETSTNVIVLAATNRPDILDPALLRPGRFDRRVILDTPDIRGRTAILEVHSKGKPMEPEIDLTEIAKQTPGFSGADLANLINESAILAARRNRKSISFDEMTEAIDRVIAGPARKSRVISPQEKKVVAYHEAGHALVAQLEPDADRVHKISIVARGRMGGYTRFVPDEERTLQTKEQFRAIIAAAMGGRAAEMIKFDQITTGASDDIERATAIAKSMVTQYGMSERLGPRSFGKRQEMIFLGKELGEQRDYSLRTEAIIDQEIDAELDRGLTEAKRYISENMDALERIALFLLENETIDQKQIVALIADEEMPEPPAPKPTPKPEAEAEAEPESPPETTDSPDISRPEPEGI
ncbi:MAG: ATP-dependent zinc metalloprotease FtsH [Chloroflexi bacterium]|nr:ATP-dependent zinc metalloprotease FtsH [Chloroflexota bacterium]MCH8221796.1 ATP-dependent zinc metalloprotease FtsH [Chloroflexota bacterium]